MNRRPSSSHNQTCLVQDSLRYPCNQGHKNITLNRNFHNEETLIYLRQIVNPIISPGIQYILKENVDDAKDIPLLFLNYLKKHRNSKCNNELVQDLGVRNIMSQRQKERCRCFESSLVSTKTSSKLTTFVSQVLRATLKDKPETNLIKELISIVENIKESYIDPKSPSSLIDIGRRRLKIEILESTNAGQSNASSSINLVFLLLGLPNSGKTTLVSVLKGQTNTNCKPSLGFRPFSLKYREGVNITFYDIGGGVRSIWPNYYHNVHGIIYVVDSASSVKSLKVSVEVAKTSLTHRYLQGKPLLVISNKSDKRESKSIDFIVDRMNLVVPGGERGMTRILSTSLLQTDPNLDVALEWLIQKTISNITDLNQRIARDSDQVKVVKTKKEETKEKRIFSNALCRAFSLNGEQCSDVFDKDDGEDFFAEEIGLTRSLLPNEGKELCALVGYQRFALMIIGNMINKKKRSWIEVLSYVRTIRVGLGLEKN